MNNYNVEITLKNNVIKEFTIKCKNKSQCVNVINIIINDEQRRKNIHYYKHLIKVRIKEMELENEEKNI